MVIDLSLTNNDLYAGCEVELVAGRFNLTTPVSQAIEIVGTNIGNMIATIPQADRNSVTLTGPMAVWSYLIVFHAVVHAFAEVKYNDGRSDDVVIARHGAAQV
jgi:hypothetical protein